MNPPSETAPRAGGRALLAGRLAWRQHPVEKKRLASAIAGVMFACVLVFMQLGFRAALFDSATALPQAMRAELFLMHPMTTATFRPEPLPRARAWQALAAPAVANAVPIYLAQATWRNPADGTRRMSQWMGLAVEADAVALEGLSPLKNALKAPDTAAFDLRSRPEFGPVGDMFAANGPLEVQVGNRMIVVVGTVALG
ncbi:MAG: lipid ABC transporter, partial [Tagaea sp.]